MMGGGPQKVDPIPATVHPEMAFPGNKLVENIWGQISDELQPNEGFKSYKQCKSHVEEKTTARALERQIEKCDNTLVTLCSGSDPVARTNIPGIDHGYFSIFVLLCSR